MNLKVIRSICARALPFALRRKVPLLVAQHLYFQGNFKARLYGKSVVKLASKGHQIENEIYWRGFDGCHEMKSMQIFADIIKVIKPRVVWDIGANSGTYGILAKALNQDSEVYFFEPIPKAAEMIRQNLNLNNFSAKVFELALGDYDGEGAIYFSKGADFATSVTVNRNTLSEGQLSDELKIEVKRADSLITEYSLPIPDLVKLDVETYEYEVLNGFGSNSLKDCIFLIEILSEELARKLIPIFPSSEYDYFNINDSESTVRKTKELSKSDFYNYLICRKGVSSRLTTLSS